MQGGLDFDLRRKCVEGMIKMDLPGYAIGGLAGGESKVHPFFYILFCFYMSFL